MHHHKLVTAFISLALAGCTFSTGVIPIGQDTYMIGSQGKSPGGFSGTEAKALAFTEAQKFCASKGRNVQVINTQQSDMSFGKNANAEVQFMCLQQGDPQLGRPNLERVPDQLIQIKAPAAAAPAPMEKTKDMYSELLKLEELKRRGLLSEAEFEGQRKRLLSLP